MTYLNAEILSPLMENHKTSCCNQRFFMRSEDDKAAKSKAVDSGKEESKPRSSSRSDTSETSKSDSESDTKGEDSATDAENDGIMMAMASHYLYTTAKQRHCVKMRSPSMIAGVVCSTVDDTMMSRFLTLLSTPSLRPLIDMQLLAYRIVNSMNRWHLFLVILTS